MTRVLHTKIKLLSRETSRYDNGYKIKNIIKRYIPVYIANEYFI